MAPDTNGWSRSELYVMEELKRLSGEVAANGRALADLRVNLERKSAAWGAISGAVVSALALLFRR
jgi:hypothetical protein